MPARGSKVLVVCILIIAAACVAVVVFVLNRARAYQPPPLVFDGSSDALKQTVIVPTLDSPIPEGKNVIWCATFQLAWNELRDDVIGEPVRITGAKDICARLNTATATTADLEPGSYYAKAGFVNAGTVEQIEKDMASRFPDVTPPEFDVDDPDLVAVMYAYLAASVKFSSPFYENDTKLGFKGVPVSSFGISATNHDARHEVLRQVEILYSPGSAYDDWSPDDEFVIDPCKHTTPYQIILARIALRATLTETLSDLNAKLAEDRGSDLYEGEPFLVPNLNWKLSHQFGDLEDKFLGNQGHESRWLEELHQRIEFRLDRSGAELRSQASGMEKDAAEGERRFVFDRPFLIVMKKRGAERPFFVMWVDNAELLCKP